MNLDKMENPDVDASVKQQWMEDVDTIAKFLDIPQSTAIQVMQGNILALFMDVNRELMKRVMRIENVLSDDHPELDAPRIVLPS